MFGGTDEKIEKAVRTKNAAALIKLAGSSDTPVRIKAIAGLGRFKDGDGFNFLIMQLRNVDAEIRSAAASALGELGDGTARLHVSAQFARETDAKTKEIMAAVIIKLKS